MYISQFTIRIISSYLARQWCWVYYDLTDFFVIQLIHFRGNCVKFDLKSKNIFYVLTAHRLLKHPETMTQFPFYDVHTLTTGKGWLVLKSPWVSHIGLEASTWSVANLSALPTCIVQYMIVSGWICFMFRTSSTTTLNTQRKEVSIMELYSCWCNLNVYSLSYLKVD